MFWVVWRLKQKRKWFLQKHDAFSPNDFDHSSRWFLGLFVAIHHKNCLFGDFLLLVSSKIELEEKYHSVTDMNSMKILRHERDRDKTLWQHWKDYMHLHAFLSIFLLLPLQSYTCTYQRFTPLFYSNFPKKAASLKDLLKLLQKNWKGMT